MSAGGGAAAEAAGAQKSSWPELAGTPVAAAVELLKKETGFKVIPVPGVSAAGVFNVTAASLLLWRRRLQQRRVGAAEAGHDSLAAFCCHCLPRRWSLMPCCLVGSAQTAAL